MSDITIPKLNTVDTSYVLVEWLLDEGAEVAPDAAVAVVETSKATQELTSAVGGFLHRIVEPPADCELGAVIGRVFAADSDRLRFVESSVAMTDISAVSAVSAVSATAGKTGAEPAEFILTNSARDLADRHGITEERLRALGKKIIKSADIEALVAAPGPAAPAGTDRPSRAQRAVAEVVSLSHRTIPAAYSVVRIEADHALAVLRQCSDEAHRTIGLPELLVKCVAVLHKEFPVFFSAVQADGTPTPSAAPRVGVTVDVGTGLSIPVIADADHSSLPDIARALAGVRVKALRGQLRATDLADANIALALNDDTGIVFAQPLIQPPNACMLSLCAPQQELALDAEGRVIARTYVLLGLAYDHRVANGREAALFLRAIGSAVEDPERLRELVAVDPEARRP